MISKLSKQLFSLALATFGFVSFTNAQVGQIIWEEDFNTLNSSTWNIDVGDGCSGESGCGWGNQELESYQEDNVYIEEIGDEPGNNALVLEAKSETAGTSSFTSGKVNTQNNLAIKYGMIEIRMKVPDLEVGLWPAAWLLGTSITSEGWPKCGEIDMMEMGQSAEFRTDKGLTGASENDVVGSNLIFYSDAAYDATTNPTGAASIAYDNYYCTPYQSATPMNDRFVIYRLYWDDEELLFTVEDDGIIHNQYTGAFPLGDDSQEFNKPFYLLLNLAVGGSFTDAATVGEVTAPLPAKMYVDYIRVRKWNGMGEVTTSEDMMANAGGDQDVDEGTLVTLDAQGSYGAIVSYAWFEDGVEIATGITNDLTLTAGTHIITLIITDAEGNTESDELTIQVGDSGIGEIIWEDNFDTFDTDIWNTEVGNGCGDPSGCGWGNQELEYYQSENVSIEEISGESGNNALVLEAKSETVGTNEFTSGKVTTINNLAIKYGVVEVRMQVPDLETGLWPAAWLLGANIESVGWPICGEIDMMEMGHSATERERQGHAGVSANNYVGANLIWYSDEACADDNPTCAASIAFDTGYDQPYVPTEAMNDRFLIYRIYWEEASLRFTVEDNGVEYDLYTTEFPIGEGEEAFNQPFYFIMNLAVGGLFTDALTNAEVTATMPAKMYVDYVRVRKWKGQGEVSFDGGELLASAGVDQSTIDEDKSGSELISLNASASYGSIETYEWSENGAVLATGETPSVNLSAGTHYITLTISDIDGNTASDIVKIDVREIIWEENFDTFATEFWNIEEGNGCELGPDLCGWGNQELEYYQEDNVSIEEISGESGNNALVLEARSETVGESEFTSGKVTTADKVTVKYGMIETRMMVPDLETGLWPAAWLLGANIETEGWPKCGEIDMMEMGQNEQFISDKGLTGATENEVVGSNLIFYSEDAYDATTNPTGAASIAYDDYYCTPYNSATPMNDRFMIYRVYWDNQQIRLTAIDDGVEYDMYTGPFPLGESSQEFNKPFHFLLNLAVGGNFTDATTVDQVTAPIPAKMYVDYIRVTKWNGMGEVAFGGAPVASAGTDIIQIDSDGNGTEQVILDGTLSNDQDGTIESYSWSDGVSEIATGSHPTVSLSRGSYTITLTVTDNDGKISTDEVLVVVTSGGLAPNADAGADQTINENDDSDSESVTLDGSGSSEANTPIVSYSWLENSIEIATGINPTFDLSTGIHTITLEVTDEEDLSGTDEVVITIIDLNNIAPIADAGSDQATSDDDGDDMASVTLDGSGSTDSDGTIDAYTWLDNGIEIATGVNPTIDLSTGVHTIQLLISDNDGTTGSDEVVVTISDPNNVVPIANAGINKTIIDDDLDGSASYTLDGSGSSDSDGTLTNYVWYALGSEIATGSKPTVELSLGLHTITLEVTDNDGATDTDEVLIKINHTPIADAGNDVIALDDDQDASETVSLDGSGSDDSYGTIVSYSWQENSVEIATGENTDYAFAIGEHTVTLIVTDDDGYESSDELTITVKNPLNEAPIADAGTGSVVLDTDGDGSEIIALDGSGSSDSDGTIVSYSWVENSIEFSTDMSPTVTLELGDHEITLTVTDNEGESASSTVNYRIIQASCNITPTCSSDYTVEVNSADAANTSITFIPSVVGNGDPTCLLFYGTTENGSYGANAPTPNTPYALNGINDGDIVYFYYTYSLASGGENNTNACRQQFAVGQCAAPDNNVPFADAGTNQEVVDTDGSGSELTSLDGSSSIDFDGTIDSYSWTEGGTEIATGVNPTVNLDAGVHTITLEVTDNEGSTDSDDVTITVTTPTNIVPTADAGPNEVIIDTDDNDEQDYSLDGSASTDSDGTVASYSWLEGGIEIATGINPSVTLAVGVHTITLEVTDNEGATNTDLVVITVNSPTNIAPIADAGADATLLDSDDNGSEAHSLDGSGSSDTNGSIASYSWVEGGVEIATGVNPSVTLSIGTHTISLVVTDNKGLTNTDEVVITVNSTSNTAPTADAGDDDTTLDADDSGDEQYTLDGSGSTDTDGTIASYSWLENAVEIATGVNPTLTLSTGIHMITLKITDNGGATATDNVIITIAEPVNIAPTANAGADDSIFDTDDNGSQAYSLDGSASTDSDGIVDNYSWVEDGDEIATGVNPSVTLALGVHTITLEVTDDEGATDTDVVVITVNEPDNVAPTANAGADETIIDSDENGSEAYSFDASGSTDTDGTIVSYSWVEDGDEIATEVNPSVTLALGVHTITLEVTDDEGATNTDVVVITVNEPANIAPIANAGADETIIDSDGDGSEDYSLDASESTDADGTIESYSWVESDTEIATGINPTVTLAVGIHTITLEVTDDEGAMEVDSVVITVDMASSVRETAIEIDLYPTPVTDILNIKSMHGDVQNIQLFNSAGIRVMEVNNTSKIDMNDLSSGIYLIQITINNESVIRKVIKN